MEEWHKIPTRSGGAQAPRLRTQRIPPEENDTENQKMTGDGDSHGEGDSRGHIIYGVINVGQTPRDRQGPGHRPRAARGGKRTRDTVAEAGMRRGAQIQVAEAGG